MESLMVSTLDSVPWYGLYHITDADGPGTTDDRPRCQGFTGTTDDRPRCQGFAGGRGGGGHRGFLVLRRAFGAAGARHRRGLDRQSDRAGALSPDLHRADVAVSG